MARCYPAQFQTSTYHWTDGRVAPQSNCRKIAITLTTLVRSEKPPFFTTQNRRPEPPSTSANFALDSTAFSLYIRSRDGTKVSSEVLEPYRRNGLTVAFCVLGRSCPWGHARCDITCDESPKDFVYCDQELMGAGGAERGETPTAVSSAPYDMKGTLRKTCR
jgi:hypothetical protein